MLYQKHMASVKVFPRLDKANKQGLVPMYLRLTKNRKSKYIALDVYIDPKNWNVKTGKLKPTAKNASQINNFLAYDIKSKIIGKAPEDFFAFVELHRKALFENLTIGSMRRYEGILSKLKKFCKNEPLFFDEINVRFIYDFQQYLKDEMQNHTNTIHSNLKVIRKMISYAVSEDVLPAEKNPFNKIKLKGEKTIRAFLLDDELERMEKLELEKGSMLNHHRNLYIFSAYTGGVRISDLLMMRWKNFDGEHLVFQMRKTKEELSIKLPQKSLKLIAYYRELANKKPGSNEIEPRSFMFPLLRIDKDETNELQIFKAISSATAFTNKSCAN